MDVFFAIIMLTLFALFVYAVHIRIRKGRWPRLRDFIRDHSSRQ